MIVGGVFGWVTNNTSQAAGPRDMKGNIVHIDNDGTGSDTKSTDGALPSVASSSDTNTTLMFSVPSVGLDVPLRGMDEVGGDITPPGFQEAYVIRNRGATLSDPGNGTIYVAMHSLRGGGIGPGNFIIDVNSASAKVHAGATIRLGGLSYIVSGSRVVKKTDLPTDRVLWYNTPGRLVVLTCLQNPMQTASTENVVIEAHLSTSGEG